MNPKYWFDKYFFLLCSRRLSTARIWWLWVSPWKTHNKFSYCFLFIGIFSAVRPHIPPPFSKSRWIYIDLYFRGLIYQLPCNLWMPCAVSEFWCFELEVDSFQAYIIFSRTPEIYQLELDAEDTYRIKEFWPGNLLWAFVLNGIELISLQATQNFLSFAKYNLDSKKESGCYCCC